MTTRLDHAERSGWGFADFSAASTIDSRVGSRPSIVGQKHPSRKPNPVCETMNRAGVGFDPREARKHIR
jgi:hypothetical protein